MEDKKTFKKPTVPSKIKGYIEDKIKRRNLYKNMEEKGKVPRNEKL